MTDPSCSAFFTIQAVSLKRLQNADHSIRFISSLPFIHMHLCIAIDLILPGFTA
jgi:hypothetical protein